MGGKLNGSLEGIAAVPKPGAEFGSLNSVNEPNMQDMLDPDVNDIFSASRKVVLERHIPDSLAKRGTYKGIVLKVLPPPPEPEGWLRRIYGPLGVRAPVLVRIIARIPELDAALPEPSQYGDDPGPWQQVIQMHTIFTAVDDTIPVPAVGSVVELDFEDKQNFEGPKYISAVGEQAQNVGASGGPASSPSPHAAAYAFAQTGQCAGTLAATGPSGAPLGTSAGSYPAGNLPSGRAADGPWYSRPDGKEGVTTLVIHSTAGGQYDSAEDGLRSWIGHGTRSENRVSTHFVITEDGTIVNLLPPFEAGGWHSGWMNRISVGVDLSGNPDPDSSYHTPAQFAALAQLVETAELYDLAIIAHRHHKRQRSDPGHFLDAGKWPSSFRGTTNAPDEFPWDQEPFRSRALPQVTAIGLREDGPPVGASGLAGEPANRTWTDTEAQMGEGDAYDAAYDSEHDVRVGGVGPTRQLGSRPLEEIHNRLKSSRSPVGRVSFLELPNMVDMYNQYHIGVTGRPAPPRGTPASITDAIPGANAVQNVVENLTSLWPGADPTEQVWEVFNTSTDESEPWLNIRTEMGGDDIGDLPDGTKLNVLESTTGWSRVRIVSAADQPVGLALDGGVSEGWVNSSYIRLVAGGAA